ncbi:hypothetical protein SAMN02745166_01285 [Prosthecobacter debontii]|uniref:Tetratricopeptide repeat-containing protein n=1 Tax=Prosthecobacter debontii TaxID=48467 RepID=A0A1T4XB46_9BACT|nr:tetratricopeptide repeat protein [Prosthecobacter debontii]SKA86348.1 hypothetical protein SAMN02745166_01285 [Prosthecobacter debontii]
MYRRLVFLSWLVTSTLNGQAPEIPAEAKRYHDLLKRRPQAGTLFDRFHDTWLESASADSLLEFLKNQAARSDASASDHRLLALLQSRRGQDADALLSLETAIKLSPMDAEAWFEKSQLQARALDFDAALQSLKQAMEAGPKDLLRVEIAREQGKFLLRLNRTTEALQTWIELTKQHPDDLDLTEDVIELMAEEGLYSEASSEAQHLVELTRNASEKLTRQLRWADLLLRAEKRDESLKVLETCLAQSGQDSWVEADVLARLDQMFRREDDLEGLKTRLEALSQTHPQRSQVGKAYANALAELGEATEAAKIFRDLLARNPGKRNLQEDYIALLEQMELIPEAAEQAQIIVSQYPEDKELLIRLAGLQHRQKDNDAAAQATLDAYLGKSQVNGKTPETDQLRVARLLEAWQLPEATRKAYETLASAYPESISAQEALAHYLHRAKDHPAALKVWTELAKNGQVEDLLRIGQALLSHGLTVEAEKILSEKEQAFAQEPRFLTLLAQLAFANKKPDQAVRLHRARLDLGPDAAPLQESVRQAAQAIRDAHASEKTISELQTHTDRLTLPYRCLLSQLLDEAGQEDAALAALEMPQASPSDSLALGLQKVRLLEMRQDFTRAQETLAEVMRLPTGLTSDHTRQMVKLCRLSQSYDQAMVAIADWKKLSPGAVQPWLEEAGILMEQANQNAALDVLRTASRKFSDNLEVMEALANELANGGKTQEAYSAYMALYEQTEDPIARLRLLYPLAQMSSVTGGLPRLLEEFQKRQRQNRASALPWMALAAIHAATNNDEERRRCLYEASRLRPKDLPLLTEIARIEEESGLYPEALRTLQAAASLDSTNATKSKMASLLIETGDEEAGYQLMFELMNTDQADARVIEKTADTLAANGRWDLTISFLTPLLERFPNDYRLHYLHAVALEEDGQQTKAITAFIHMLGMHEEIPSMISAQANSNAQWQTYSGEIPDLPEGTSEWSKLPQVAQLAYQHHQKQRGYPPSTFSTVAPGGQSALTNGWVLQPTNVTNLSAMALYHLVEIGQGMNADEKAALARRLETAGIRDSSLLLEIPMFEGAIGIPPDLLAAYPDHAALHAIWLMNINQFEGDVVPGLKRCMSLFKDRYPRLAVQAAMAALRFEDDNAAQLVQEGLRIAESIPKADAVLVNNVLSALIVHSQRQKNAKLHPLLDRITTLAIKWSKDLLDEPVSPQSFWSAYSLILHLGLVNRWNELPSLLEQENSRQLQNSAHLMLQSSAYGQAYLQPNFLQPIWSQTDVSPNLANIILQLGYARNSYHPFRGTLEKNSPEVQAGLQKVLDGLTTPGLRTLIQLRLNTEPKLIIESLQKTLTDSTLSADHWIFAAWVAQQLKEWHQTLAWLGEASRRHPPAHVQKMIDNAIFMAGQNHRTLSSDEQRIVRDAFRRAKANYSASPQRDTLIALAAGLDLQDEAEDLRQAPQRSTSARQRTRGVNPYSRQFSQAQRSASPTLVKLLSKENHAAAFREFRRSVKAIGQSWLSPYSGNAPSLAEELRRTLDKQQVTARFLEQLQNEPKSNGKELQERGAFFELFGQTDAAIQSYSAALSLAPRAWDVRARLAILTSESAPREALTHLSAIPSFELRQILQRLSNDISSGSGQGRTFAKRLATIRLLTAYVSQKADSKRRMDPMLAGILAQMPYQIQQGEYDPLRFPSLYESSLSESLTEDAVHAREQLRAAYKEFCLALMKVPMLCMSGFAPYAGLALKEGQPMQTLEPVALEVLDRQALALRYTPAMRHWLGRSHNRFITQGDQITAPQPEDILVRLYAERGQLAPLENTVMPLLKKAYGDFAEQQARAYARLYLCPESEFLKAARDWLQSQSTGADPGSGQEIARIWSHRKLQTPIHEIYLERIREASFSTPSSELQSYLNILTLAGRDQDARTFIQQVRSEWLGNSPEERTKTVDAFVQRQMSQNRGNHLWMGYSNDEALMKVNAYLALLREMMEKQPRFLALSLIKDDGLLEKPYVSEQISYALTSSNVAQSSLPELLQVMEALNFLAPAKSFRTWKSPTRQQESFLKSYLAAFRSDSSSSLIESLAKRQPLEFGAEFLMAVLQPDSEKRLSAINDFFKKRGPELPEMSETARCEFSAFLKQRLPGFPWSLSAEAQATLSPIKEAERAQSNQMADTVLAAKTWDALAIENYDFQSSLVAVIDDVSSQHPEKALQLLKHAVTLLKGSREQLQASSVSSSPIYRLITDMGRVPALMKGVLDIARAENFPPEWIDQYRSAMTRSDLLQRPDYALTLFKGTPFVAEAEDFSSIALNDRYEGSLLASILSRLKNNQGIASSEKLMADLHQRQPRTFGEDLTLALMTGLPIELESFILKRADDFPKLAPAEANSLLATFIAKDRKYNVPAQLEDRLKTSLAFLYQARDQADEATIDRLLNAPSLQDAGRSLGSVDELASLLRRVSKVHPERSSVLFGKITLLISSADRQQNSSSRLATSALGQWLAQCAGIPQTFTLALQRAENEGILDEEDWIRQVAQNIGYNNGLLSGLEMIELLKHSSFIADLETFRSYPIKNDPRGSCFSYVTHGVRNGNASLPEVEEWLEQQPETFGRDLFLWVIQQKSKNDLLDLLSKYEKAISQLSVEKRQEVTPVIESLLSPLAIYLQDRPSLQPLLAHQRQQAKDAKETLLAIQDYGTLQQSYSDRDQLAAILVKIVQCDPAGADQVIQHLLSHFDLADRRNSGTPNPAYTESAYFLASLKRDPGLWPLMSREALARDLHQNKDWQQNASCIHYFSTAGMDPRLAEDALTRCGLFNDAADFNPLVGLGLPGDVSLLHYLSERLIKLSFAKPVQEALQRRKHASFGSDLIQTFLAGDRDKALNQFAIQHGADFQKMPVEIQRTLVASIQNQWPSLDKTKSLPAETQKQLQPILDIREEEKRQFAEDILKAKAFSDFKMSESRFAEACKRQILETLQAGNAERAVGLFHQATSIIVNQDTQGGWNLFRSSEGLSLKSTFFLRWLTSTDFTTLAFGLKVLNEDQTGQLVHTGWHGDYGWGFTLFQKWRQHLGLADPAHALEQTLNELAQKTEDQPVALLGLAFHQMILRMTGSDVRLASDWALKLPAEHSLKALAQEFHCAAKLYLESHPDGVGDDGTCILAHTDSQKKLWAHYRQTIFNEKLSPQVRIAVGYHLCMNYPWVVPADLVLPLAKLIADENLQMHSVRMTSIAAVIRCMARLPVTTEFRKIAESLWEGWMKRQRLASSSSTAQFSVGLNDTHLFAMLQLAGQLQRDEWIDILFGKAKHLQQNRSTIAVLTYSGYPEKAAELLQRFHLEMTSWQSGIYSWHPDLRKHLPALKAACKDAGVALLAEMIVLQASDPAPQLLRAFGEKETLDQRIGSLASKVVSTSFSDDRVQLHAASIVANYAPEQAMTHLADFFMENSSRFSIERITPLQSGGDRAMMAYLNATYIVIQAAKGNTTPWQLTFKTPRSSSSSDDYLMRTIAHYATDQITTLWQQGQAREAKIWLPIFETTLSRFGKRFYPEKLVGAAYIMATQTPDGLAAWKARLPIDQRLQAEESLRSYSLILEKAAAICGSSGDPNRLSDAKRIDLVMQLLHDKHFSNPFELLVNIIHKHKLLSVDEALTHGESIYQTTPNNMDKILQLVSCGVDRGRLKETLTLIEALERSFQGRNLNYVTLLKAQVLVRMSDKAQASSALSQLTPSNLDESQRNQVTELQKLIQVIK